MERAILLVSAPDRVGLVHEITGFIAKNNGNIINLDQHIDPDTKTFLMRVEWDITNFKIKKENIKKEFEKVAKQYEMTFEVKFSSDIQKVAIFVSKLGHCLHDLLYRFSSGDLPGKVVAVFSNHKDFEDLAKFYGIPYFYFPITKENKLEQEKKELEILKALDVDLIILARYMQILSKQFVEKYENKIINIHHSFLPAFPGAKPYHRAYKRGVKIIGATSHYVTEELDAGPIIEQDVIRVSHKDTIEDFIKKGQDLEKLVLASSIHPPPSSVEKSKTDRLPYQI